MDSRFPIDRRRFLGWASAWTAWISSHPTDALGTPGSDPQPRAGEKTAPRILSLELLSAAPLPLMREFYGRALGLRVLDEQPDRLAVGAGGTRLTFVRAAPDSGKPFYHFAFNIPENKVLAARAWQIDRTPLMPIPERLRDPAFPDDVVHFRHWNAHSVFFLDPAGNVVEYIARHDLSNGAPGPFASEDILYSSEIGLIVDQVTESATKLKEIVGLEQYRGGDDQFTAVGDERGLLLVMKRGRHLNFNPSDPEKAARVFRTVASVRGARRTAYRFPGLPYELSIAP